MAGNREIRCIGPSAQLADRKSAVQRAVNLYMRQVDGLGENVQVVLDSAPGLELVQDFGVEARGLYSTGGRIFVVAGSTLFETTSGTGVSRGTLATSSGFVCLKHGRDQLVLVDGLNGYVLNLNTNVFAKITDPDFRGSNWVEEMDGYFIFSAPGTDQWYISQIDDGSNFDALDFSSADTSPDNLITFRTLKRELILLGEVSGEVWIDSGDPDFPFARYNATPIDVGVVGNRAATRTTDSLLWVGKTERGQGYVYEMRGHQPVRVSTTAVEEALASSTDLTQCVMWSYHIRGAEFVGVQAPGMSSTWVYDLATQQWHERGELVSGDWAQSRVDAVAFFAGDHYAIDGTKYYRMSTDLNTLAGDALVRERTWPHLMAGSLEPIPYRSVEIACTTGEGGHITLECSNDGGFVWGPPLIRSLGTTGRRMERVRWHFLGSARDRVFRLRCSDAVPLTIHSATVDAG